MLHYVVTFHVEFVIKTMDSEYICYACFVDREGTMWNNDNFYILKTKTKALYRSDFDLA